MELAEGETRTLRYTTNALAAFEEETGQKLGSLQEQFQGGDVGVTDLRALLWAGLLHSEDPDGRGVFTQRDAGELMPLDRFEEVAEAVQEAIELAMGVDPDDDEVEGDPEDKQAAAPGTGPA